jgi:hypothetical protein
MSSSTTKQDTVAKTARLARTAVIEFGLERRLPHPIGIRRPRALGVFVDVATVDHELWVEATGAEYLGTETLHHEGARFARVSWLGNVPTPVGDVPVVIRIAQRLDDAPTLSLVPSGGAA